MEDRKGKSPRLGATIRWAARILCILAIAFISLFALDVFEQGSLGQKAVAFLLHMIPSFALIIVLIFAWKNELVGGILMTLAGLGASAFVYSLNYGRSHSVPRGLQTAAMIGVPFVIVGLLFMISYVLHRPKTLAAQAP